MYNNYQRAILEKVEDTALFLNNRELIFHDKKLKLMERREVFDLCHQIFPKLGKKFYMRFLQNQDKIFPGKKSQFILKSGKIEINYTGTINDVASVAHENGHSNQSDWLNSLMTVEIYTRTVEKILDDITGDLSFNRYFMHDITCYNRNLLSQCTIAKTRQAVRTASPKEVNHLVGSILAIPVYEAVKRGEYELDTVANWSDENVCAFLNSHGITQKEILKSVENYFEQYNI